MNILSIIEEFKEILYPMFGILISIYGLFGISKYIDPVETEEEKEELIEKTELIMNRGDQF